MIFHIPCLHSCFKHRSSLLASLIFLNPTTMLFIFKVYVSSIRDDTSLTNSPLFDDNDIWAAWNCCSKNTCLKESFQGVHKDSFLIDLLTTRLSLNKFFSVKSSTFVHSVFSSSVKVSYVNVTWHISSLCYLVSLVWLAKAVLHTILWDDHCDVVTRCLHFLSRTVANGSICLDPEFLISTI